MAAPRIRLPLIEPYPEDATYEQRLAMFQQWQERFAADNPDYLRPDGTLRPLSEVMDRISR